MSIKVTVVVPVYNPGPYLEPGVTSLLAQTLPKDEFEVIFVDDGSTDATPARLDALAQEHDHFRVIHQENSGWAGKPRNVGIEAARGEFIQFLDQDDALGRDALRRLYLMGSRNASDIVIGKVTSNFRHTPHRIFRDNVDRCTIHDFPLIGTLTPHKMFSRSFLLDNGLRYPEGRRRLEDQLFMVQAYFVARAVSIVGDYPCYFYNGRDDRGNAGSTPPDPVVYYENLGEVLDVIESQTEPGEFRDTLLARFYRREVLVRLREPGIFVWSHDHRQRLFEEARRIALERFPRNIPPLLPHLTELRARLLEAGDLDGMITLAERCATLQTAARLTDTTWTKSRTLRLGITAELEWDDGSPFVVIARDGGHVMEPRLTSGVVDDTVFDLARELEEIEVEVAVRHRASHVLWFAPNDLRPALVPAPEQGPGAHRLVFEGSADIDPRSVAGGRALGRGTWDVSVSIRAFGLVRRSRLGAAELAGKDGPPPALIGRRPHVVIPLFTDKGNLTLDVDEHKRWLASEVARRKPLKVSVTDGRLSTRLPVVTATGKRWPARLTLAAGRTGDPPSYTVPARITPRNGRAVLRADLTVTPAAGPVARLRPGTYTLLLHSGKRRRAPVTAGVVTISTTSAVRRAARAWRRRARGLTRR